MQFDPVLSASLRYRETEITASENKNLTKQFDKDSFDNELFKLEVNFTKQADNTKVAISALMKKRIAPELFAIHFKMPKTGKVVCLDRYYQLRTVKTSVWNNDLTPLYLAYTYDNYQWLFTNTSGLFSYHAIDKGESLEFTIFIDAAALHPKWSYRDGKRISSASPMVNAGHESCIEFCVLSSPTQIDMPFLSRYPNGADAAFVLTDHCDYDDTNRLDSFLHGNGNGWLGKGLKITKGAFTLKSNAPNAKKASTLEDNDYAGLMQKLQNDGSEIVPHALNQSGQITGIEFRTALHKISNAYKPQTWIDHGSYLKYCYSVGGADDPQYTLIDNLKHNGFTSLWSYFDIQVAPSHSLNHFTETTQHGTTAIILHKILKGQFLIAAHHLKSMLERSDTGTKWQSLALKFVYLFRTKVMSAKQSPKIKTASLKDILKTSAETYLPYTVDEIIHFSPALYGESGKPFHQVDKNEMTLFATQEVVQIDNSYTKEALDKLIRERGLHLGHTYILNSLPYINGIYKRSTQNTLADYWINFTNDLSELVKAGRIWNPNMGEFVSYMKQLNSLKFEYCSLNKIRITNNSKEGLTGLTLYASANIDPYGISWDGKKPKLKINQGSGMTTFWNDIPAYATIDIEWQ